MFRVSRERARLAGVDETGELESAYRQESTRIRAWLAARLGDVRLAEDLVQDAFIEALEHWRADWRPRIPAAGSRRRPGAKR